MQQKDGSALFVIRWDWLPGKDGVHNEATTKWVESAVRSALGVGGVTVYQTFRNAAGSPKIISTLGFENVARWSTWYANAKIQTMLREAAELTRNFSTELLGPSPVLPEALFPPGGKEDGPVTYVVRWNTYAPKEAEYRAWVQPSVEQVLQVPGILGIHAYRSHTGDPHVVILGEFKSFATWAAWYDHETTQRVLDEGALYVTDSGAELWGPIPQVEGPIRPGLSQIFKLFK